MKKQIAVLMAAATAVTTVAPALAHADVNNYSSSVSEANAKIKAALNVRYKDPKQDGIHTSNANDVAAYLNSRYAVAIVTQNAITNPENYDLVELNKSDYASNLDGKAGQVGSAILEGQKGVENTANAYVVKDATRVQGLLENLALKTNPEAVGVVIVDKGEKDGSSVETLTNKHYVGYKADKKVDEDTQVLLGSAAKTLYENLKTDTKKGFVKTLKVAINNGSLVDATEQDYSTKNVTEIKVTLTSGKEYTLGLGDQAFDFDSPLTDAGKAIDLTKANAQNVLDQITKFEYQENEDGQKATVTLPVGNTDVLTVHDVLSSTIELGKIFTIDNGYTKEGADLVNAIVDSREDVIKGKGLKTFNFRGVNYKYVGVTVTKDGSYNDGKLNDSTIPSKIEKVSDGYVLKFNVVVNDVSNGYKNLNLQFVIKGDSQKDLSLVLSNLQGDRNVVEGRFTRLQGSNRYATAVAVSQETFKDGKKANTVVIAGGEALIDGLSAVPLASAKNAPVLLANPTSGLDADTVKEIKRVVKNLDRKIVYVVGGEKSVPAKAVAQLEEMGAVVERLSGSNRYETSLEVARTLGSVSKDLFVVGGEGAADAMSASPVAATISEGKVSPILVVPQAGVSKTTRNYVANKFKNQNIHIVGGENSVSSNVYRGLNANGVTIDRTAGTNRFDTNVQLIKKFYGNDKIKVGGAIFTSGENKYLVDAQTSGPLAAKDGLPIVLADSRLTDDQVKLLKKNGVLAKVNNVYQVGGVVSADVMKTVVQLLGL